MVFIRSSVLVRLTIPLLITAALVVYWQTGNNGFVNFDDDVYPENDDNYSATPWGDDYLYLPLADDCNSLSGGS